MERINTSRPYCYDRSRIKIGWWNNQSRRNICDCCGREIKRSCSMRITADDGASVWVEMGVACAARVVAKYPSPRSVA